MPDYHQIVDQIRGIVQSSDQTRNERLEQLAADYAAACGEANQRLGRCQWLLQQGLRSEAIQLADSEPRLLDAVAALDFRERAEWDELVGIYGLAAPPKLMVEAAGFLNEAYAQEEPLQDLLVKHRRLAMQRSSLRLRIGAMRQLAAQDPNNLVWADDLRAFEKARFRQIQVEAAEAVRLGDPVHIGRLLAEVQQQKWVEPPPRALLQGLAKADAQLRGQHTRAALADLDARLNDAFAACDSIRGRIVRNEWIALTASSPLDPGDPIWERVSPALGWLEDEDRRDANDKAHEAAMSALVRALDEPGFIPPAELQRLGQTVLSHGQGMPESLQQRFLSRLETAEKAHARRFRVIAGGAAAAAVLAAVLVFALVRGYLRAGEASQAAVSITDLIELGELDRAGEFIRTLEKADPGLLAYPAMIDASQRFQVARGKEADRALRFDQAMREAERAPLAASEPKSVETARSLAKGETERQAIANLVEQRRMALKAEREKHETTLRPKLDEIGQAVYNIGQRIESPPVNEAEVHESILKLRRSLEEMAPQLELAGDELKGQADELGHKLGGIVNRLDQIHRQSQLLEGITAAVAYSPAGARPVAEPLANALQACIQADPASPRSQAFQAVLNERPFWESLAAWSQLAAGWKPAAEGLTPSEAKARADACGQFLNQHPEFPNGDAVVAYQRFTEAISRRTPGVENSPPAKLHRLLSDTLVDNVWMVTVTSREADGRILKNKYYTRGHPAEKNAFVQFMSLISFNGKEQARIFTSDRVTSQGKSPQSKIAADFKPILEDQARLAQWEDVMRGLVVRIIREPEIDPILQVALLRRVLDSAMEASEPFKEAFEPMKTRLDQAGIDINVPWMNPETANLDRAHGAASQCVETVLRLLPPAERINSARDRIERGALQIYPTLGWLAREREGWRIRTGATIPKQGELWSALPSGQKGGRLVKLGRIDGGKPTIDVRDSSVLAEGRPVFMLWVNR